MIILRARPEQAGELTHIALAAKRHWGYPEHWIELWTPQLTLTPEQLRDLPVYAALVGDQMAGFYALSPGQPPFALDHLWVLPACMGCGVGRALFEHAAQTARGLGAALLQIESDPNAEGFYARMGARRVGERVSTVDGQERRLPLMELDLRL